MSVSKHVNPLPTKLVKLLLFCLLAATSFAQDPAPQATSPAGPPLTPLPQAPMPQRNAHPYSDLDYSRGKKQWPNPFVVYGTREVAPLNVANSGRTDRLLLDGKLYLSLNDAVAMALEDNLDIGIQRYNLSIADTDILRTSSGAVALGVNAGLVQGTPGGQTGTTSAGGTGTSTTGSTGGGVGGTTIGVGGAGAGVGGIVASTQGEGPPIDNFDPVITGTVSEEHAITPEANTVFTGTPSLDQNTTTANFLYSQGFSTGTLMTVAFNNSRVASNALFNTLNPNLTPNFRLELRQHLLSGFGYDPNLRWIRIARNNKEIEDVTFRLQVIQTVSQIENIYWDLVNAYSNVTVQQRALDLALKTLSDNQKQVAAGTLAPLTVVQAQSAVATAQQNLIAAQVNLQLQQLLMKNAITRNMADPILAVAPVIPTDTLNITQPYQVATVEDLINAALQQRPEIATARLTLTNAEISRKSIRNQLLPTVDLYAFYGASALSGVQNPLCTNANRGCLPPGTIPPTSYWDAFQNLYNGSAPDKGVGVNININLRNRQTQADQVRSVLEYRQGQMSLQQTENTIRLQVRQAQFALQQNYVALQAAIAARDYAAQNLDAEQKKLRMGASTSTLVLQASSALTQAESNVLAAATNYEKSKVQLDLSTADTLAKLGIDLTDAEAAKVQHMPKVPGVVPANTNDWTQPNVKPIPVPGVNTPEQPNMSPQNPPQGREPLQAPPH
ncbi:MAG: TolC family protein [Candidatus Korobacteraceae bacterium]